MKLEGFDCPLCGAKLDVRLGEHIAICPSCGAEYQIGTDDTPDNSPTEPVVRMQTHGHAKIQKNVMMLFGALAIVAFVLVVAISAAACNHSNRGVSQEELASDSKTAENDSTLTTSESDDKDPEADSVSDDDKTIEEPASSFEDVAKTWELGEGFYTAGVDIPAGRFDVTPTGGIGYISSENDFANLRGPGYEDEDGYANSYKNYKLAVGETLELQGVQIRIDYSVINSDIKGRQYDESKAIELSPGNYIVGKDIDAGRYNVQYVSGEGGFVSSERIEGECIISSNMDGDPETDEYVDFISNALLVDGEEFNITTGLTLLFIPEVR